MNGLDEAIRREARRQRLDLRIERVVTEGGAAAWDPAVARSVVSAVLARLANPSGPEPSAQPGRPTREAPE